LRFVATFLPGLRSRWEVTLGERLQHVLRSVEIVRPRYVPLGTDNNWLSFSIQYGSDGGGLELSRSDIQRLLNKGESRMRLPDGRVAAVDLTACAEANEVLYDVQPRQEGEAFRARPSQAGFL